MWSLAMPATPALGCVHASSPERVQSFRCNQWIPRPGASFCRPVSFQRAVPHSRDVLCQAHPRRVAKVSKQIEREIGRLMLTDKVLMDVTQSRTSNGDRRGSLCSCSGVHVTNDLQVVKVYMSVLSDDVVVKERVLSRLSGLSGYVRRQIGERVRLRLTPEIRFVHDEAVERGERVLSLLKKIESGDDDVATGSSSQNGNVADESGEGFWEDSIAAGSDTVAVKQENPFLEGVGDSDFDSDDEYEPSSFFSADMFPDANPVLDDIAAQKRQTEWEGQKTKPRYKVKGGNAVRK